MIGHMMVSRVIPEFAINEDQARALAVAVCNYLRHTKIKVDPKTRDLWALVWCVCMVEGPCVFMFLQRISHEAQARKANQAMRDSASGKIVPITPPGAPGTGDLWQMPTGAPRPH
jgi:hypothetical protein